MGSSNHSVNLSVKKFEPSQQLKTLAIALTALGFLGFVIGFIKNPERMWTSYLTAFFYVTCFATGGLFFVTIQHVAKAGWSAGVRRLAEGFTAFLPVTLIGSLVLLLGSSKLYQWTRPEILEASPLIASKTAYLNLPFMTLRLIVFGALAIIFAKLMVGNSLKQDQNGDASLTTKNTAFGVAYTLIFAITFSVFSVDLLMSLLPTWYSTIYGIYTFAGSIQSTFALLILVMLYMKNKGFITGYVTIEHVHDVAKFLKGFTVFWAYIAFSQFMLIWYANIPEETEFYLMRAQGGWMVISMSLLILKFIVPFLALLPRGAKRNESHLVLVCALVLIMQYVDIYWLVYPTFFDNHVVFGFYEVALLAGFVGIFMLTVMKFYQTHSLVAIKDPRMHESVNHHVSY
jgi:hypothetical protein